MSNTVIFIIGFMVSLLCAAFLIITFHEMKKMGDAADARAKSAQKDVS